MNLEKNWWFFPAIGGSIGLVVLVLIVSGEKGYIYMLIIAIAIVVAKRRRRKNSDVEIEMKSNHVSEYVNFLWIFTEISAGEEIQTQLLSLIPLLKTVGRSISPNFTSWENSVKVTLPPPTFTHYIKGAFGVVYQCKWRNTIVAVKQMKVDKQDLTTINAFKKEVDNMKKLVSFDNAIRHWQFPKRPHPNVIQVTDFISIYVIISALRCVHRSN